MILDISSHVSIHYIRVAAKSIVSVEIQVGVEDLKWNSELLPQVYTLSGKCRAWAFFDQMQITCAHQITKSLSPLPRDTTTKFPRPAGSKASSESQRGQIEFW